MHYIRQFNPINHPAKKSKKNHQIPLQSVSLHPDKKIPDCGNNFGEFKPAIPHEGSFPQ
ncbi:hypothetical protein FHS11_001218 [Mucilaginibacter gotjawali]|uniref:Uncharacterized protein n=1 Tax=Mucilaginibacter gotjawali TaxID=1550579 RepID=A0A839SB51_9SPHI|nr:hypothetical protein [Mucilaginibacter gotjawali]